VGSEPDPPPDTLTVSALCSQIRELVSGVFPSVWVVGEIQRLKSSRTGHLYFELVEKGTDDEIVGKLDVAIWRTYNRQLQARLARLGARLEEGQEIRCLGRVDFYEAGGRLQLVASDVDPTFTLGRLELRRRETIQALRRAGLEASNRSLELAVVPLAVALVTSEESAAYHDFLSTLSECPYGFRVTFVHAAVQGPGAERELASALRAAGALQVDCIALVRGGGSRTDLAVFDSRAVAEAVARAERPVVAGLGHETDRSVVDLVSHTSLKTPTKVAEFLIERVSAAELRLDRIGVELRHHALGHLREARDLVARCERSIDRVTLRLAGARRRLEFASRGLERAARAALAAGETRRRVTARRLADAAPRYLARRRSLPERLFERFDPAVSRRLAVGRERLGAYARLCSGLSPARVLSRGFSVTRDERGAVVRRRADVAPGSRLSTELADGRIVSRVEDG
jgi:exodeoxyribonuclease VII large subunit